nr:hypothetical protein [Tanacetum cinerariifolium]
MQSLTTLISEEEHMEIGTADAETVANLGIGAISDIREDKEEFEERSVQRHDGDRSRSIGYWWYFRVYWRRCS